MKRERHNVPERKQNNIEQAAITSEFKHINLGICKFPVLLQKSGWRIVHEQWRTLWTMCEDDEGE